MKKIVFYCVLAIGVLICTACGSSNTQAESNSLKNDLTVTSDANISKNDLISLFQKWDSTVIDEEEKVQIITYMDNYLNTNQLCNADEIKEISQNFQIINFNDIYVICYMEALALYGESGRQSYIWLVNDENKKLVFNCDSKYVEKIVQDKNNEDVYYLIGYDYLLTNSTGIYISRIHLKDGNIEFTKDVIELQSTENFHKQNGVLYGNSQLVVEENNNQLIVKELNGESNINLFLTKEHLWKEELNVKLNV